jgi:hypothetical protein
VYYSPNQSYFFFFGGDEEAEVFMKATEIELRLFSDKNYPGFVKTFALKYYVLGGYYVSYEYVCLQRVMVKRIILGTVAGSL